MPTIVDHGVTYQTAGHPCHWPDDPGLDAKRIWGPIYQGAAPPPGPWLGERGFRVLILTAEMPWEVHGQSYLRVDTWCCPLEDELMPVTPAMWGEIDRAVDHVERILQGLYPEGWIPPILIACQQGKNRSALVTAEVLRRVTKWSGEQCVTHIQKISARTFSNHCFAASVRERSR